MNSNNNANRRYDIDWLRVLAFITLIFYHIGMYYVSEWGWHIKSNQQSESLQYLMLLVNQWRMPLIFFISGFALCLVEPRFSRARLLSLRFKRLFVPLVFGMFVIVVPQSYYQAIWQHDYQGNYFEFWSQYINFSTTILPEMQHPPAGLLTWNHLWYLAYLWCYTLLYLAIKPAIEFLSTKYLQAKPHAVSIVLIPIALMTFYGLWLKPKYSISHDLFNDWYNHALSFTVFLFGYIFAKSPTYIDYITKNRYIFLAFALCCYSFLMIFVVASDAKFTGASRLFVQAIVYTNVWCWLLMITGFARSLLNKPSQQLSYMNEAILPWYILHQTMIIILAMQLKTFNLPLWLDASLLIIGTFSICAISYEIIRRLRLLRFLFGMKPLNN